MQAADALHQRENDRFRCQMAVEQYQREVAEAQAINSRPVYSKRAELNAGLQKALN